MVAAPRCSRSTTVLQGSCFDEQQVRPGQMCCDSH